MKTQLSFLLCLTCVIALGCSDKKDSAPSDNSQSTTTDSGADTDGADDSSDDADSADTNAQPSDTDSAASDAEPVLIDVRSKDEWDSGHIETAVHIPHGEIGDSIADVVNDLNAPILLYCRSGGRAGVALEELKKMGYTNVQNLGGMQDAEAHLEQQ